MESETSGEGRELHLLYDHGKDLGGTGTTGTPETCGKILGISLSGDRWGCEGRRPIDLSTIPIPLESGSLMDSGVFILNFSTCRKVLNLVKFITGLHLGEAWVLETGDCKTREILHFPPFR